LIEAYFRALLEAIAASPVAWAPDVTLDQRGPRVGLIRGEVYFSDGSLLHFRELVELRTSALRVMYSYHYQRAEGTLVFRYDDTAHHPELATFPQHKHIGDEATVVAATAPDLSAVLAEIAALLLP